MKQLNGESLAVYKSKQKTHQLTIPNISKLRPNRNLYITLYITLYIAHYHNIMLGCVHIDMSTSIGPGFRLWPVEASLVPVERSWSLVQADNSTHVGHIE